MEFLFNV